MSDELCEVYIRDYDPNEPVFVAEISDPSCGSETPTTKRYCKNCIHYKYDMVTFESRLVDEKQHCHCMAPQNFSDNYYNESTSPKSIPSIINRFNNCQWYDNGIDPSLDPSIDSEIDPNEDVIEFYEF